MDSSFSSNLRIWNRPAPPVSRERAAASRGALEPSGLAMQGPHNITEFAARLYVNEALNPPTSVLRRIEQTEPYSLEWFETIESLRHGRQGRWIPRLLEFTKHAGETLVCLGHGLGTDWVQYARHGANVVVCSPVQSQLGLVRRNFELRGLRGQFLHASLVGLPLESASIDVACVAGLLELAPEPQAVIEEIYRVLKPGGKALILAPARYDIAFWQRAIFFWQRWLRRNEPERSAAGIRTSSRDLRRLFHRFVEHRTRKRHLRRADVPHVWRWLPLPVLERVMGRVLVLKAFKPLSAALPAQVAAAA
jgi:SAM-dependent methyltransferase